MNALSRQLTAWVMVTIMAAASGCRSAEPWAEGENRVIVVADAGVFEAPRVEMRPFSTVCWWNDGASTSGTLEIVLDRPVAESEPCRTTVGFANCHEGKACQAHIAPSKCATLCFHDPGVYPYRMTRAGRTVTGEIVIRAKESP